MCFKSLVFRVPSRVFVKFACLTQLHVEQISVCDVASGHFGCENQQTPDLLIYGAQSL